MPPATPAPAISPARVAVSAALARRPRAMAGSAASRAREAIRGGPPGRLVVLRLPPTKKIPRKETDADHGSERPDRAGLDGLDQRVPGIVAHLARLAGNAVGSVLGCLGVAVDEALGGLDRLVEGLAALALDGVDGIVGVVRHGAGHALELRLQRVDFFDQILAGNGVGRAVAAHHRSSGLWGRL